MRASDTGGGFPTMLAALLALAIVVGVSASVGFWMGQRSIMKTEPAPAGSPTIYKPKEMLV